jgi:hypothetical protein
MYFQIIATWSKVTTVVILSCRVPHQLLMDALSTLYSAHILFIKPILPTLTY